MIAARTASIILAGLPTLQFSLAGLPDSEVTEDAATERIVLLVVDLEGDGLHLSDRYYPVYLDIDGNGDPERVNWTATGHDEAFLWLDEDGDDALATEELLGFRRSPALSGSTGGWRDLLLLDQADAGGNGDGALTPADAAWHLIEIWIDQDHDGLPLPAELSTLSAWGVEGIDLDFVTGLEIDGALNLQLAWSQLHRQANAKRGTAGRAGRVWEVHFPLHRR